MRVSVRISVWTTVQATLIEERLTRGITIRHA